MAILPIRTYPDPVLRKKSPEAEPGTGDIRKLAEDMLETMYSAPGIGLAAPQVGLNTRMIVVDVKGALGNPDPHVFLNPVITASSDRVAFEEGCLSLPEFTLEVDRSRVIQVTYTDLEGSQKSLLAEDLLAVVIQHEIDHLNGRLLVDYASPIRRDIYRRKARKMKAR
jgi:peptide deformylase